VFLLENSMTVSPRYAGFWIRFLAFFLDGIILIIPSFLLDFLLYTLITPRGVGYVEYSLNTDVLYPSYEVTSVLSSIILGVLYYGLMTASKHQGTLGKMIVGIKVVRLDHTRLSKGRAIGRYFASTLSGLIMSIGYIMVAFSKKKQGLHDRICSTIVVYK
jgi:uncharacterized RDD family membrane protein YckC